MTLLQLSFLSSLFLFPIFLQMSVLTCSLTFIHTLGLAMILKNVCYRKRKYPEAYFDIKNIFGNIIYNQMKQSLVNPINSTPHRAAGEKSRWVKEQKKDKRNLDTREQSLKHVLPQEFPTLSN